ncbi:unnamed protein product [Linum tenue]|uniref:Uncharacterized protein n=1 Tax=Linum tenue TaxID=586396 RepID=A0AAV0NQQ7_9ROSI|nr:unnamed protein product [Linum tenue]
MRRSCVQLVITFSLFSVLTSISWVTSGMVAKSYVYIKFNPFFSSFFTHTLGLKRKYMFLIFNGILAFLATSASSASSTTAIIRSSISSQTTSASSYAHHHDEGIVEEERSAAVHEDCDEIDDDSDVEEGVVHEEVVVHEEKMMKVQGGDCRNQFQQQGVERVVVEEEEEEEEGSEVEGEGGNGCSTEEMNSRFDELLRKMKVRMMSESKQQKLLLQKLIPFI